MTELAFDAALLVGFGGPEHHDEVMPFLERVTAGRRVPRERLEVVAEHYHALGGASPINAQNRSLVAALSARLAARGVVVPVAIGNRNSPPYVDAALADLARAGHRRVLAFAASAFSSYSGCRQYREDLAAGREHAGLAATLDVVKEPPFVDLPGFAAAWADRLAVALRTAGPDATVLFTTHSLPLAMAAAAGPDGGAYVAQHLAVAEAVASASAAGLGRPVPPWRLVYQSRSGPPHVPWLEPDVNDAVRALAADGVGSVVVVPLGFLTDHMEVVWDLDHELAATAASVGVQLTRVATVGDHPAFLDDLADRLAAHLRGGPAHPAVPPGGPGELAVRRSRTIRVPAGLCSAGCCRNGAPGDADLPVVPGGAHS